MFQRKHESAPIIEGNRIGVCQRLEWREWSGDGKERWDQEAWRKVEIKAEQQAWNRETEFKPVFIVVIVHYNTLD